MIKVVVFDLDDTVYSYTNCNAYAEQKLEAYVLQTFGIESDEFFTLLKKSKKIVKERLGDVGSSHNRLLYMQTLLELIGKKPATKALEMYDIYWDAMLEKMELYPYVLPLFEELKRKQIKIAVLTDLTAHIQHRKIQKMGLENYIDVLVTSEEAGVEKPDKKAFDLLKEKCGVSIEEMLMIGDSQKKDIEGAKRAGMYAILFDASMAHDMDRMVKRYIND